MQDHENFPKLSNPSHPSPTSIATLSVAVRAAQAQGQWEQCPFPLLPRGENQQRNIYILLLLSQH